ncbi:unnamed protein product [Phyllotreta striolata]|uniref:Cathepsin O n=1 Tax=Phyllotreta striolata TaxID=444603 RepID=A0A9N9TKL9_PHYSR|nr:unnamed protein product [Phyllotreta striolata]
MPVGPNVAETPRFARFRKFTETLFYILLLCLVYPITFDQTERTFQTYLRNFNKSYENEEVYRQKFEAFKESLRRIDELNSYMKDGSIVYGLTKYSDMSPEEFSSSKLVYKRPFQPIESLSKRSLNELKFSKFNNLPLKVDLREKNYVSEVLTQGSCGACWAFSVIGIIESTKALQDGNLTKLSIQQMIDCSYYNFGCTGGDICSLLDWLVTYNIEITTEEAYPLKLRTEPCNPPRSNRTTKLRSYDCRSFVQREQLMLHHVATRGPLAVGINAESWQHYIGGTIQYHCSNVASSLNHAVQIIGYDLTAPVPYYIVKNSWGEDFGEKGYLKVAVGRNLCGLAHEVASVRVL